MTTECPNVIKELDTLKNKLSFELFLLASRLNITI